MTVTQLTNSVCGEFLQNNVRQASMELASVQAGCNVNSLFRPSVVDLETGMHGIRWLIARILTETGEMTTAEICASVRSVNGYNKYPDKTILHNLSHVMAQAGQVTSRQLYNGKRGRPEYAWRLAVDLAKLPPVELVA